MRAFYLSRLPGRRDLLLVIIPEGVVSGSVELVGRWAIGYVGRFGAWPVGLFSNHKLVGLFSRDRLSSWCKWCLGPIRIPQFPWMISESIHGEF